MPMKHQAPGSARDVEEDGLPLRPLPHDTLRAMESGRPPRFQLSE